MSHDHLFSAPLPPPVSGTASSPVQPSSHSSGAAREMESESIFIDVGDSNDSNEQAAPENNVVRDPGRPPRGKKAKVTKHEDPDNVHTREKSSEVWETFARCKTDARKMECKFCGEKYVWIDSTYGTSTLTRHMKKCPKMARYGDVGRMMLDNEAMTRTRKIDPKRVREIISMAIVAHDLPISFVEYKFIRKLLNYLYPEGKTIGRSTATSDIVELFHIEKEKLKHVMTACPGRICFTSGSSYPTSDLYFNQIWKIECFLKINLGSQDEDIKSMATSMKEKFDKYWSEYSTVLAFGAVLDPRAKLGMIKYCYSQLDADSAQAKVDDIRRNLQMLYDEYTKWMTLAQPSGSSQSSSNSSSFAIATVGGKGKEPVDHASLYDVLQDWQSESNTQTEKSALDQYLDETPLEFKYFPNLNVLEFWKNYKERCPILSVMACDILSIPITTVASESAFSIGGRVLNKFRNRLLGDHVEALICTRSWLQGFTEDEEDMEEDILSKGNERSNVVQIEDSD